MARERAPRGNCCGRRLVGRWWSLAIGLTVAGLSASGYAYGHAVAGQRVFPSTLSFDDPGIGAELPMVFSHSSSDGATTNEFDLSVTKPITPKFSLTAAMGYVNVDPDHAPSIYGWSNLELGAKWLALVDAETESIASLAFNASVANTGGHQVGDDFDTFSPEVDFGQGFGRLPVSWLRPMAVTGAVAFDFPDDPHESHVMDWDLSVQYSIPYLQDFVKYVGIKAPFNNMVAIIEAPMETALDRGGSGQTTGYIDPGVIWIGHYFQWGIEMQLPVNNRSGNAVGVLVGLDFYLDDLLPHSFGAPLFK